jgi:formylglycine-generating enzyme required for sulfatase activity
MNDNPRQKLIELVAKYGDHVWEDAKRCEGFLRDLCGDQKREIAILIAALRENVAVELRETHGRLPLSLVVDRCSKRLHENTGVVPDLAKWSVETWGLALGLIDPKTFIADPQSPTQAWQRSSSFVPDLTNSIGVRFVLVPSGAFKMSVGLGSCEVTISRPFFMGMFQVTQSQYESVAGVNPSYKKGPSNPVEQISWEDAKNFCQKLSLLPSERAAGRVYRLPTEAEWEYSCRAGSTTSYCFGDDPANLAEYAWYYSNSQSSHHPVGQRKPNAWGLFDMHGNVAEWCSDWYGPQTTQSIADPVGPSQGLERVYRGGSFLGAAKNCQSTNRLGHNPYTRYNYIGFRLAMNAP